MSTYPQSSRRQFLQQSSIAALPLVVPCSIFGQGERPAPSERIQVGVVGLGSRGFNLIDDLLNEADAQIVAVCDVHDRHYRDNAWGKGRGFGRLPAKQYIEEKYNAAAKGQGKHAVDVTDDFRELCGREDLDAIVIATPDHWHALCTTEALQQGKDVYCEKPVTHLFAEGQAIYRAVKEHNAVFQTGSQQRSSREFRRAVELIRNGVIGEVQRIEVGLPPGYDGPQGDTTVTDPPQGLDYDRWCGPSEKLPYMRARHHRWWRGHRAYGGGVLMDWIGHHNDIAHWSLDLDESGPTQVTAVDWTFPDSDDYNTPFHYEIACEYEGGITSSIADMHLLGTKWYGENAWVHVTRGKLTASDPRWLEEGFDSGSFQLGESPGHMRNFLDCVRSRKLCISPAETTHRSITPGHLAFVSQEMGRSLKWDAEHERVIDDDDANERLQSITYREPWTSDSL